MADLTLNNVVNPQGMVIFDGVPNIVNVNEVVYGSKAIVQLTILQPPLVLSDGRYNITIMGETITNVVNPNNENGKRFKVYQDREAFASSVASALRNCQRLISLFNIYSSGRTVMLEARAIGRLDVTATSNIGASHLGISVTDGDVFSQLYNRRIQLDVNVDGEYKTTLEKRMYGKDCSFDISNVLSPYAKHGQLSPFTIGVKAVDNSGVMVNVGSVGGDVTPGYLVDDSMPYLYNTEPQLLLSGNDGLTIYDKTMQVTVLSPDRFTFKYEVLSPDGTVLDSSTDEIYSSGITDLHFWSTDDAMESGSVFNISAGTQSASYRIIKPVKAAEKFERVCWRNEHGGVSFFDFTGNDSVSYNLQKTTYNKSWFDFYSNPSFAHEKMADNGTITEVQLRSHLLTEKETEIFRSLSRASAVWVPKREYDDATGKMEIITDQRPIIITSLDISENESYPGVFTATVRFRYSY